DFVKFSGEDERTTWEHISQYIAQLGEIGNYEAFRVRLFSLSLTGTAFAWFSSLAPGSIMSWNQLERKFHDHFYSGNHEMKLADLASVRQGRDETVSQFMRRFKGIKNRCFNLSISEVDLAGLCFRGLKSSIREKIDNCDYYSVAQVHIRAEVAEGRMNKEKESFKTRRSNVHIVDYESDDSTDDDNDVYLAEFVWPANKKTVSYSSLKPIHKNRQEDIKFTFDVSKCDRIFDELHKFGYIKISHVIPPTEELRKRAYCKFHNSFSHATNDCNVFRRQVQSAINESRLKFHEMQVDETPFPVNTMELQQPKVLVRPHQAESTKGKNVVIGEERPSSKESVREVTYEKTADGKESFKVTVKSSGQGGQGLVATPELRAPGSSLL
ncbi:hypothetical protein FA727_23640, partial [Robertmurraya kyonggiensis]